MHLINNKPILFIEHATVRYLDKILFPQLTFSIREGEQWAVIGKSGSGKTALLQTILGKYNIVDGAVRYPFYDDYIREHGIKKPPFTYRNFISYVSFQPHFKNKQHTTSFYYQQRFHAWDAEEVITVNEYLDETISKLSEYLSHVSIRFSTQWIIDQFKLDYLLDKTLIQLSNGETRRLLFAIALLSQPKLLLLDNPLTGLDAESRIFYSELLRQIIQKGTSLLLVTSGREIPDYITHVLELNQGKIVASHKKEIFDSFHKESPVSWKMDNQKLNVLTKVMEKTNSFNNIVSLKNIHIKYGDTIILDHINWTIKKGEKWALTGPNGAGKSTLLSLITGDNPQAYANDIILFDKKRGKGESIWDIKAKIGYVSPELHQYFPFNCTSLDVILSGYTDTLVPMKKKLSDFHTSHTVGWMELLQIDHLKDRQFKFISAGEQRLVLLARAIVKNPPLLILDEPCQGLDLEQKELFKNITEELCKGSDKTLIYVSHYKEDIPGCVTNFMVIDKGHTISQTHI